MAVETPAFAAMLGRMIRAYGRRVADADEVDLAQMLQLREDLEEAIAAAIEGQRLRGRSWAYIARGLGTSRQYAQRAYGPVTSSNRDSAVS